MYEYEFRLVVRHAEKSLVPLLDDMVDAWIRSGHTVLKPPRDSSVYYVQPHFRLRDGRLETKKIVQEQAVYHDGMWFRWVQSCETEFRQWSRETHGKILHGLSNFQDPVRVQLRRYVGLDEHAQLYTFRDSSGWYRLVFEWEYGTFAKPLKEVPARHVLESLGAYRSVYSMMRGYDCPPYTLDETMTRKVVSCIDEVPQGETYLYASKLDGVFGLVYSYPHRIKEIWEGHECKVRRDATLGDGFVFAAERLDEENTVVLLDVYQVRGLAVASWSRRSVLLEFLPTIPLCPGYDVQRYEESVEALPPTTYKTDGLIVHDTVKDEAFKIKKRHSIDVVFHGGYFWFPKRDGEDGRRRFKCLEDSKTMDDGKVYEVADGRVVRKRTDRFTGNSTKQLDAILGKDWQGIKTELEPVGPKKRVAKRKFKM